MIGIYKITNKLNGKSYIGQSIDIKRRWRQHCNSCGSNQMYEDFKKFGLENFEFEIIEECPQEKLNEREIYWISYYNTYNNGYNLTRGGEGNSYYIIPPQGDKINFVAKNSMRLFYYLYLISSFTADNRNMIMHQKIIFSDIKSKLNMHYDTIKKNLQSFEESKALLVGESDEDLTEPWSYRYSLRKKDKWFYYIFNDNLFYRLDKSILNILFYTDGMKELDFKVFLLVKILVEDQGVDDFFPLATIREMLQMANEKKNNDAIANALCKLKFLELIDYEELSLKTNFGTSMRLFKINSIAAAKMWRDF